MIVEDNTMIIEESDMHFFLGRLLSAYVSTSATTPINIRLPKLKTIKLQGHSFLVDYYAPAANRIGAEQALMEEPVDTSRQQRTSGHTKPAKTKRTSNGHASESDKEK